MAMDYALFFVEISQIYTRLAVSGLIRGVEIVLPCANCSHHSIRKLPRNNEMKIMYFGAEGRTTIQGDLHSYSFAARYEPLA